ncbi:hypothetical protein KIN20_028154 [Parelaphostrongylus tenuis]|uniref:Cytochrome b561 domain-containing protein n=1 Tax=Parelaphostrongylus tenuis TaxID=148309 RepID=A0AAD5R0C4_PARTN|nr:hypothetical protein KIN20_028154 [Parelaphostrongylus tenuis]
MPWHSRMRLRFPVFFSLIQLVNGHLDMSTCGKTKQCIFAPNGCLNQGECTQIFTYSAKEDGWVDMEMVSSNDFPSNNYLAVGFSEDDQMGEEPVTQCIFPHAGKAGVYFSYNIGKSNEDPTTTEDLAAQKENLKLIHAHKDEEGMYCHFKQMSSNNSKFAPNLDKAYQLLLVRGETDYPTGVSLHIVDPHSPGYPYISEGKVNVGQVQKRDTQSSLVNDRNSVGSPLEVETTTQASGPSPQTRRWLVRIHGLLMILAWIVFLTTGVLAARYLRDNFSSSTPFGLKWWFHLHRTLNLIALPLILASTLIIFIARNWRWRGPTIYKSIGENFTSGSIHSLLGTIAILIAIVQPLLALMRCQPDTGARPLFNWVHRSLGIAGILFSVIAHFIAANWFMSLWSSPTWSVVVVIFYIIVMILSIVLFEILSYLKSKPPNKTISLELRNRSAHRFDDSGKVINVPPKIINEKPLYGVATLYVFFALFSICVAALLILMLTT